MAAKRVEDAAVIKRSLGMRKLTLSIIGMHMLILSAFSQGKSSGDSTFYKNRKLKFEEANFVSGYYHQEGNNSAVTGGIGTEKLSDFANTIDLKFSTYGRRLKHTLNFEIGIDHYTSASSDKIDPHGASFNLTSPSYSDTRFYPSVGWSVQNEKTKTTVGANLSYSTEFDYTSRGIGVNFTKASKNNNTEFSAKLQAYFDTWAVIYPVELRTSVRTYDDDDNGIQGYSPRNSYSGSLSIARVVNKKLQVLLVAEPTYQKGLLATKYQRVYFNDGSLQAENLPGTRTKIPIGIRANYFLGDKFILRSFYRYYQDNWGVRAHTFEFELPVKLSPFFSISPFYRYYAQSAANYFAPYGQHVPSEAFYTSDYDLSKFNSNYLGGNIRLVPANGLFGSQHFHSVEVRFGHYLRSNGLNANQLSLHLQFK
jgi:uncharacterized protein DUF3570